MSTDKTTENDKGDYQQQEFTLPPKSEWALMSQGAEARVWKIKKTIVVDRSDSDDDGGVQKRKPQEQYIVCKERFSKAYRHPDLDARLTKSRCRSEAKILEKLGRTSSSSLSSSCSSSFSADSSQQPIRVPRVIRISPPSLFLEYIDGPSVKEFLRSRILKATTTKKGEENNDHNQKEDCNSSISLEDLAKSIGQMVGRIHNKGIVHGDLTTSNMMMIFKVGIDDGDDGAGETHSNSNTAAVTSYDLCPIDFGLAKSTTSAEEQAVDLYVLERALESTHPELPGTFLQQILTSYGEETSSKKNETDFNIGKATPVATAARTTKRTSSTQSTLDRLEQVRMRGRKRECFG
jgi:TP53 regulating kinase-like protein